MVMPHPTPAKSSFWRNHLRQWHWISSALCLTGLLLFAVTGFTLNHATQIEAKPKTIRLEKHLPASAVVDLKLLHDKATVPSKLVHTLKAATGVDVRGRTAEVSEDGIYIDLAGPGVDASLTLDPVAGTASYEHTDRGVIAALNDLHKGRNAGPAWGLFIDLFALACVIFSVTGLGLLWLYARGRQVTWPLVAAGLVVPLLLFLLFVHL